MQPTFASASASAPTPAHARHSRAARRSRAAHAPLRLRFLLLLLAGLLIHAPRLRAEPLSFATLTTRKGVTYTDVKVSRFDALELRFTHANGISTVPLADLPADLQTLFGYDPKNEDLALKDKQAQRAKSIITDADEKAKTAAIREEKEADAAELQRIRREPHRCYISGVQRTADALLIAVFPVQRLPVKIPSRSGRTERVKLTPQGKPELQEQPVPGQTFELGPTLRILPENVPLTPGKVIDVYVITTEVGPEAICAPSPEAALEYRKKLAAYKASGNIPPPRTEPPAPAPAPGSAPEPGAANP